MKTNKIMNSLLIMLLPAFAMAQSINIDASVEHQVIDGFGGMNHTSWVTDLNTDQRAKVYNNAPGNIGLSILRIHIDPDTSRFIEQVPTSTFALSQGAKVFATPWDPPADLLDESSGNKKIPYENYGAYVDHLNGFNDFMEENGVPLYAISVQNEPDYGEWTRWTKEEIFTFVEENAQDINNRVIAAESFNFNHEYTDPILNDSTAASHVEIIGGHIYGSGLVDYPLAREKNKAVWMTEHLTGSNASETNNWSDALALGKEINDCMEANFNAYNWWYIRRFYGLMNEDGNLTHKGYAMMHFSKFVRPNAVRIDANVASASGVYASAFKTDSSMTIVAINNSAESKEITFTINNASYNEFVLFSSNGTEYLVNKGAIAASSGTFTTTLEAKSMATITTNPQAGGAFNNIAPIAVAGDDLELEDTDGSSDETITLDASASSDEDGEIVNFNWALNGTQLSNDTVLDVTLPIGNHEITLAVTDNDGARSIDTFQVSITSIYNTELWFEAECIEVGENWGTGANNDASNFAYVYAPDGTQSPDSASLNPDDQIAINFSVEEASAYKVWGRLITPSANDDSFWVKIDSSDWIMWNGIPASEDWHWDDVHDGSDENPASWDLEAGDHTLYICFREDGALLDKIFIGNTGIIPNDMGGEATPCNAIETTTELWFEAECIEVGAVWEENSDDNASNNKYVNTPAGTESPDGPSNEPDDLLQLTFDITEPSSYLLWARVKTPSANDDSFYVKMDDEDWTTWNGIPASSSWQWAYVFESADTPKMYSLTAGEHTLSICYREDGALLDKIAIINTGAVPTELGGTANNCGTNIANSAAEQNATIYPNPAKNEISLSWGQAFSTITIYNTQGKAVFVKNYANAIKNTNEQLNLEAGVYVVIFQNENSTATSKLIINK